MTADSLLWLLQANDSGYPSGAYAHSSGLEELVACGVVSNAADLELFLQRQILPALLTFDIPWFARAHAAAAAMNVVGLLALDAELDAWRIPAELREASRRIGSQRLELLITLDASPIVTDLHQTCPRCHQLVVCALELAALPLAAAACAYAYQAISSLTSAALKLIRIGQSACQHILRRTLAQLGLQLDAALLLEPDGWFNPLLEIASLRHARSHARLFIS